MAYLRGVISAARRRLPRRRRESREISLRDDSPTVACRSSTRLKCPARCSRRDRCITKHDCVPCAPTSLVGERRYLVADIGNPSSSARYNVRIVSNRVRTLLTVTRGASLNCESCLVGHVFIGLRPHLGCLARSFADKLERRPTLVLPSERLIRARKR